MQQPKSDQIDGPVALSQRGSKRSDGPSIWVRLANSAGFWVIAFSAFGLLSLALGEARIQKRMRKQQIKTALPYSAVESGTASNENSQHDSSETNLTGKPSLIDPDDLPPYRLTGLRWILCIAIFAGALVLARELSINRQLMVRK